MLQLSSLWTAEVQLRPNLTCRIVFVRYVAHSPEDYFVRTLVTKLLAILVVHREPHRERGVNRHVTLAFHQSTLDFDVCSRVWLYSII